MNGGVADIAAKVGRSQILTVKGGAWVILDEGMGACPGLKPSEEDGIEAEGTSDIIGIIILVDGTESNPESWTVGAIVIMLHTDTHTHTH